MEKLTITKKLSLIQQELKAPKNQYNSFGKYNYRSAEDILEALKPFQAKYDVSFMCDDEIKDTCGQVYVESTAYIIDTETRDSILSRGQAIIDFDAKGMQMPQRTGSASSYAKKYAYGNLLLIDDTKDSDGTNNHDKSNKVTKPSNEKKGGWLNKGTDAFNKVKKALDSKETTIEKVLGYYNVSKEVKELLNK